jgi:hypothetical protein
MRWIEINESVVNIPRFWLGPRGQVIELSEDESHSECVEKNPLVFGLATLEVARNPYIDEDNTESLYFYDVVIALAEGQGWVRVSRDAGGFNDGPSPIAISASVLSRAHKALQWLFKSNYFPSFVQIELEHFDFSSKQVVHQKEINLRGEDVDYFVKYGRIPRKQFAESTGGIPRMWLGPEGQSINLDNPWMSHHDYVIDHSATFGLDDTSEANGYAGDYDVNVIDALAEENGWVRISADITDVRASSGILISASSIGDVRRALKWLFDHSYYPEHLEIEVEEVNMGRVRYLEHHVLNGEEIDYFYRYGRVQRQRMHA